jgi:general secretion pathway protein G
MARKRTSSGFTLVELLVVLVIVVIVGTVATIAAIHALDKARQRSTMTDMQRIAAAVDSYVSEHQEAPRVSAIDDLVDSLTPEYAESLPTRDHWDNALSYTSDEQGGYTLESRGKDGLPGADITASRRFDFDLDIVLADGRFVASPE